MTGRGRKGDAIMGYGEGSTRQGRTVQEGGFVGA